MTEQGGDEGGSSTSERFYRGTITRVFPGSGTGVVRSQSGREIRFEAPHVVITGAACRFDELREGLAVGFDVSWTSRGLRVSMLHLAAQSGAKPTTEEGG